MDTSEQYIKMCEEAREIQCLQPRRDEYPRNYGCYYADGSIWLPRQDQLQEMVSKKWCYSIFPKVATLEENDGFQMTVFTRSYDIKDRTIVYGKSYEQLWLALVMKEKYGKTWDGTQWNEG